MSYAIEGDVVTKKKSSTANEYFCSPDSLPRSSHVPDIVCLMSSNTLAHITVDLITWAYTVIHTDKRMCLFGWGWREMEGSKMQASIPLWRHNSLFKMFEGFYGLSFQFRISTITALLAARRRKGATAELGGTEG
jgi:hypothetical protein